MIPLKNMLWPKYMLISKRITSVPTARIENVYGTHNDFYQMIKADIKQKGMLNPPVMEKNEQGNWVCRNGNHRVKFAKKNGYAIAICHPHSITMKVLKDSAYLLEDLDLVYVNQLPIN